MIKIEIDDASQLSQKEATALGHLFMQLAGHSLHAAPTTPVNDHPMSPEEFPLPRVAPVDPECSVPMPFVCPVPPPPLAHAEEVMDFNTELDSNGIPWDIRIHARNKSQTPSGVWKLGRNLSTEYVKQVLAELRGGSVAQSNPVPPVPEFTVPIPPPAPPAPAPMPLAPVLSASDLYENLLNRVTTGMGNGTLTIAAVNNILKSFKDVKGLPLVSNLAALGTFSDNDKLDLIPSILAELDKGVV